MALQQNNRVHANSPSSSSRGLSIDFFMQSSGSEPMAIKVWKTNIDTEMASMERCLKHFPLVAFDTEYPGIIIPTYADSSDDQVYRTMKINVESTKLIQCGFTLFNDDGEIGGTWEFNFSNFGDPSDKSNETSIDFLVKHGLDLSKIRTDGVDMFGYGFFPKLLDVFRRTQRRVRFVTFQGAYDFAYFISILNQGKLPESPEEFASEVVRLFGEEVYDLKVMAGYCRGLGEHLGLNKLGQLLLITRVGRAHHAGSDSLLTALVFIRINQAHPQSKVARGILYGMKKNNLVTAPATAPTSAPTPAPAPASAPAPAPAPAPGMTCQQNPASDMIIHNGHTPNYNQQQQQLPVFVYDAWSVPWMYDNGMFPQLLLRTDTGVFPSHYNNNSCFVTK